MMTIKIEFDAKNTKLAAVIGEALTKYAGGLTVYPTASVAEGLADATEEMQASTTAAVAAGKFDEAVTHGLAESVDGSPEQHQSSTPTHAESESSTTLGATSTSADAGGDGYPTHDTKGVPFNKDFCSKVADPTKAFMSSGKRKGEWKKKGGVDEQSFLDWYASQLPADSAPECVAPTGTASSQTFGPDVSGPALGPQDQGDDPSASFGDLMKWVSELQAAETLTQAEAQAAYATCGASVPDLAQPANSALRSTVVEYIKATKGL